MDIYFFKIAGYRHSQNIFDVKAEQKSDLEFTIRFSLLLKRRTKFL